jgi:hypothetical protein
MSNCNSCNRCRSCSAGLLGDWSQLAAANATRCSVSPASASGSGRLLFRMGQPAAACIALPVASSACACCIPMGRCAADLAYPET